MAIPALINNLSYKVSLLTTYFYSSAISTRQILQDYILKTASTNRDRFTLFTALTCSQFLLSIWALKRSLSNETYVSVGGQNPQSLSSRNLAEASIRHQQSELDKVTIFIYYILFQIKFLICFIVQCFLAELRWRDDKIKT